MALNFNFDASKLRRGFLLTIATVLLLAVGSLAIYTNYTYSEGTRNGTVIKLSKKGMFFKTWEGQLNIGAYTREDNQAPSTVWSFSVPSSNQQVRDDINAAIDAGKRVKLHYKEKLITLPWRGDTKYLIHKVEILQ